MVNNDGRELTLRVTITNSKQAEWIWSLLKKNDISGFPVGVSVQAVANGNLFARASELLQQRDWLLVNKQNARATELKASIIDGTVEDARWSRELLGMLRG